MSLATLLLAAGLKSFFVVLGLARGLILLAVVLLIAWGFFKVGRDKFQLWRRRTAPLPPEIHLVQDEQPDWRTRVPGEARLAVAAAMGYRPGAAYRVFELPDVRLTSLWHSELPVFGAFYDVAHTGQHYEFFARCADGIELFVTTAEPGNQRESRPGTEKIWLPKTSLVLVLAQWEEKLATHGGAVEQERSEAIFLQRVEEEHRRTMAWR